MARARGQPHLTKLQSLVFSFQQGAVGPLLYGAWSCGIIVNWASEKDFLRFVDIALGSARELEFQLDIALQLGFLGENENLIGLSQEVAKWVAGLAKAFNKPSGSSDGPGQ